MAVVTKYATAADLTAFGINSAALAVFGPNEQEAAILSASRLVDGFLRSHYTLPLTTVGADVTLHTVGIAVYLMMKGRGYNPEAGGDQSIKDGYDNAMSWLKLVAEGKVSPDITDSSVTAAEGRPAAPMMITSSSRGFFQRDQQCFPIGPFVDD